MMVRGRSITRCANLTFCSEAPASGRTSDASRLFLLSWARMPQTIVAEIRPGRRSGNASTSPAVSLPSSRACSTGASCGAVSACSTRWMPISRASSPGPLAARWRGAVGAAMASSRGDALNKTQTPENEPDVKRGPGGLRDRQRALSVKTLASGRPAVLAEPELIEAPPLPLARAVSSASSRRARRGPPRLGAATRRRAPKSR
jgi:hypothetical protein